MTAVRGMSAFHSSQSVSSATCCCSQAVTTTITFIRQRHVIVSTVAVQRSLLPELTAQLYGNAFKYPNELSAIRRTPATTTTAASATSAAAHHIRPLFPAPTANSRIPTT
ncbi:unnamed protein product [Fusarium venenatum]|uniref:Uncharacterized protein n=1 Tax=Fusarium venenatum TaxID=56646 RepID=A0A2L2TRW5_9HYPO|nr:uncharacterized protein FVRRES_08948 [Fusarium venenatum]CEI68871.1 unnamed protein product [Fusarium venenatum]